MIDASVLEGIRTEYDVEGEVLVRQIVAIFLADAPLFMRSLRESVLAGNAEGTASAAHSLKGSCVCLGARDLALLCEKFEQNAELPQAADSSLRIVEAIESELAAVCVEIESKYGTGSDAYGTPSQDVSPAGGQTLSNN